MSSVALRPSSRAPLASLLRSLVFLASLLLVALPASRVWAGGSLSVSNTSPEERDGRWKLDFKITLGQAPDFVNVGMIFEFTPTVVYERYLDEKTGDKPALAKRPAQDTSPRTSRVDVGFRGPNGKIYPTTKFDLAIKRTHGFEAGEYELVVRREDDRSTVGQKVKLKLQGENPVVDRRPVTFAPEKKAAKPAPKPSEGAETAASKASADASEEPSAETASAEEASEPAPVPAKAPPPVRPRQGSCGCRMVGLPTGGSAALVGLGLLGLAFGVRRGSRRARGGSEA